MFDISTVTPAIATRFWSKVDQSAGPDACWPWMGGRKKAGYGNFFVKRTNAGQMVFINAHKLAYLLKNGTLTTTEQVRHTCDNPPCCNPQHLISGSALDNMHDAVERGHVDYKLNGQKAIGKLTAHIQEQRRFTEQDIAEIIIARGQGESLYSIAQRYGTHYSMLDMIFHGKAYQNIPLVQKLSAVYNQGIRFQRHTRSGRLVGTLHPALLEIIETAQASGKRTVSYEVAIAEMDELFA